MPVKVPLIKFNQVVGYAIIDKEDLDLISGYNWAILHGYAISTHSGETLLMHRLILSTPKGKLTDHINGDKLDNRKSNLRVCSSKQNSWNRRPRNKWGYKGVSKKTKNPNRWYATIEINGKKKHLGCYKTPEEAGQAYKKVAQELYGDFAQGGLLSA